MGDTVRDDRRWQERGSCPSEASLFTAPRARDKGNTERAATPEFWPTRIDRLMSAGPSADAARKVRLDAQRAQALVAFDAFRTQCKHELRPVLDSGAEMLRAWGLSAHVTQTVTDQPKRVPRTLDLSLLIDRFGGRGPGKLTISATEACDVVRVQLKIGPRCGGGDIDEHVGTTTAEHLSDELVGGLVATLVEQLFRG